ncbi:MAG: hypothetical protein HW388_1413 [Dehalococcoidia bacterium]|nr:hypothetical protein [Dehalococcoidia bacterium]
MRGVSDLKGLADMRTALSTHLRSRSRDKGTPYQEVFSFGLEGLRLERELELVAKRQDRVRRRLAETRKVVEARIGQIRGAAPSDSPPAVTGDEQGPSSHLWQTMTVKY